MYIEFEHPTWCMLATWLVHDDEDSYTYEFVTCRRRKLTDDNWRQKLEDELAHARRNYPGEHVIVVAYERMDGATSFEGNSYAVLAIESEHPCRPTITHVADEIGGEIENW